MVLTTSYPLSPPPPSLHCSHLEVVQLHDYLNWRDRVKINDQYYLTGQNLREGCLCGHVCGAKQLSSKEIGLLLGSCQALCLAKSSHLDVLPLHNKLNLGESNKINTRLEKNVKLFINTDVVF